MAGDAMFKRTPPVPIDSLPGKLPTCSVPQDEDHIRIASSCISYLENLQTRHLTSDALWRDLLALTGTLRTFYGDNSIQKAWNHLCQRCQPSGFRLIPGSSEIVRFAPTISWIHARFEFESRIETSLTAQNSGLIRLILDEQQRWRIWLFTTMLEEFDDCGNPDFLQTDNATSEAVGHLPRTKGDETIMNGASTINQQVLPYFDVIVVGGGGAGLCIAGRLKALGVSTITIDRYEEPGMNWTTRYESLRLHTAKDYAHLPLSRTYTPEDPYFLGSKDIARGFQQWVRRHGIDIWHSSVVQTAEWNEQTHVWTTHILHEGTMTDVQSKYLVFAIGAGAQIPRMPSFPNRALFNGVTMHSVDYKSAKAWKGLKGVVIGAANTAHDVVNDMFLAGMSTVTMVQRNAVSVLPIDFYRRVFDNIYNEKSDIEATDRESLAPPQSIIRLQAKTGMAAFASKEPERFDPLERVGFKTNRFVDIYHQIWERQGGFYMDVGKSQEIKDGLIKVKSDAAIKEFYEHGLRFDDESEVEADVVVFCTGFEGNMRTEVAKIVGDEIGEQLEDYWQLDKEEK